jgi:hypothetical protein
MHYSKSHVYTPVECGEERPLLSRRDISSVKRPPNTKRLVGCNKNAENGRFLSFPYVCPEPVLVQRPLLVYNGIAKDMRFLTSGSAALQPPDDGSLFDGIGARQQREGRFHCELRATSCGSSSGCAIRREVHHPGDRNTSACSASSCCSCSPCSSCWWLWCWWIEVGDVGRARERWVA